MKSVGKAMIFDAPDQPLRLVEFELPELSAQEALVKVTCSTLCGM